MLQDDVDPAFVCPITQEIFKDPVIAEDGQTYQRYAIQGWLKKNKTSPKTRLPINIQNLSPNKVIKQMIQSFYRSEEEFKKLNEDNQKIEKRYSDELNKVNKNINEQQKTQKYNHIQEGVDIKAFTCPITKKLFEHPVFASDGFTYQKSAMQKWLQKQHTSPKTGQGLKDKKLVPNHAIKGMLDLMKSEQKNWLKIKQKQKRFLYIFAPKINSLYQQQILQIEKSAAQKAIQKWSQKIEIAPDKQQVIKKQIELNIYKLKQNADRFQVEQQCGSYISRQAQCNLIEKYLRDDNRVCITGSVGVGKTQLVLQFIHKSHYQNVIWLNCTANLWVYQIQVYMEKVYNCKMDKKQLLLQALYEKLNQMSLLVLDGAQNQVVISQLLSKEIRFKIIITSQAKNWSMDKIEVYQFTQEQVQRYLIKSLKEYKKQYQIEVDDCRKLSQMVGGNPLILSQAVGYIRQNDYITIQKYCQLFKSQQMLILQESCSDNSKNIYTSLVLSLHSVKKINNQTDLVLVALAYMPHECIDKDEILRFLEFFCNKGQFSKTKTKKLRQVFKILWKYSIVYKSQQCQNIYKISKVIQAVILSIHKKRGQFQNNTQKFIEWISKTKQQIKQNYKNMNWNDIYQRNILSKLCCHILNISQISDKKEDINLFLSLLHDLDQYFQYNKKRIQKAICSQALIKILKKYNHQKSKQKESLEKLLYPDSIKRFDIDDTHKQLQQKYGSRAIQRLRSIKKIQSKEDVPQMIDNCWKNTQQQQQFIFGLSQQDENNQQVDMQLYKNYGSIWRSISLMCESAQLYDKQKTALQKSLTYIQQYYKEDSKQTMNVIDRLIKVYQILGENYNKRKKQLTRRSQLFHKRKPDVKQILKYDQVYMIKFSCRKVFWVESKKLFKSKLEKLLTNLSLNHEINIGCIINLTNSKFILEQNYKANQIISNLLKILQFLKAKNKIQAIIHCRLVLQLLQNSELRHEYRIQNPLLPQMNLISLVQKLETLLEEQYQSFIQRTKVSTQLLYLLALCFGYMNDHKKRIKFLQKAFKYQKTQDFYRTFIIYQISLQLSDAYFEIGQFQKSKQSIMIAKVSLNFSKPYIPSNQLPFNYFLFQLMMEQRLQICELKIAKNSINIIKAVKN